VQVKKARKQVTTGTPQHRHSLRDWLTAYGALSPGNIISDIQQLNYFCMKDLN
jgi:hypothetical protein